MKFNFNKLLKNDKLLYVLAFLSFTNVASFVSSGDYQSTVLFIALSILTSHFTKNHSIVLMVALLVTHLMKRSVREGMKGKKEKSGKKGKKGRKHQKNKSSQEDDDESDKEEESFSSGDIDQAATLKKAYDNLDNLLGKDGMKGVTKDTTALIKQQQQLMKQIEMATPVLTNAMTMMKSPTFQKIANGDHMIGMEKMTKMMQGLGIGKSK